VISINNCKAVSLLGIGFFQLTPFATVYFTRISDLPQLSAVEKECVELYSGELTYLVKPKELIFFSVNKDNPDWMGFRLDLNTLRPSGVYEEYSEDTIREEVTVDKVVG
jgi:hypothetical protein